MRDTVHVTTDTGPTTPNPTRLGPQELQSLWPISLLLWIAGIALLPLYIFESGTPQPSHAVLVIAAVTTYLQFRIIDPRYTNLIRTFGAFVLVIAMVTIAQSMIAPADVSLMPPLFALFNFLILWTALVLRSHLGTRFLVVTATTLAVVLTGLALMSVVLTPTDLFRNSGTFNNPNQQAYFVIAAASVVAGIAFVAPLNWKLQLATYGSGVYLLAVSNSKAGFLAMVLVIVVVAITQPRIALAVTALAIVAVATTQVATTALENVQTRVSTTQRDDSLEVRGYNLLIQHPGYLIVGSGEGYSNRFDRVQEIHSTLGTVLFAYGLAGLLAFSAILFQVAHLSRIIGLAIVAPALVYGLTHNGLRFTMFWILIAVAASLGSSRRSRQPDDSQTVVNA